VSQYLTVVKYALLSIMPEIGIDELEVQYPGWLAANLVLLSGNMDAQLAKRYATPFQAPYNTQLEFWLVRLMDPRAMIKRGVEPSDRQVQTLIEDAAKVAVELQEAADAEKGKYDLPLRADMPNASGLKPAVLSHSDVTPYDWMRTQAIRAGGYGR
jgi:hypothetical protein